MSNSAPRYDAAATTAAPEENDGIFRSAQVDADAGAEEHHKTTAWQSFIHLLKGNIGPGCLSLPWAFSQLGVVRGSIACVVLAYWSSYNAWCVVVLRRHLQDEQDRDSRSNSNSGSNQDQHAMEAQSVQDHDPLVNNDVDVAQDQNAQEPEPASVTYPDLGAWAYGKRFRAYVTLCICTQQLAVCTVFFSFIGENILVVLGHLEIADPNDAWGHTLVLLTSLPPILALACLPNLKALAPVMMLATALLMAGFGLLLGVAGIEWVGRHGSSDVVNDNNVEYSLGDATPSPYSVPLALCAILYSFEGICLIFPVETSMARPKKEFGPVFVSAMVVVPLVYILISSSCVTAFGNVTNGSITAFLLEPSEFKGLTSDWSRSLLLLANTIVTISVLLTYPLQLYPALELVGPWWSGRDNSASDMNDDGSIGIDESPRTTRTAFVRVNSEDDDNNAMLRPGSPSSPGPSSNGIDSDAVTSNSNMSDDDCRNRTFEGDSPQLRLTLVALTFLVAVVIPNVQALISLAGALAGSSVALLIPPLLELAYQKRVVQDDNILVRIRCYVLLALGGLFLVIGTGASILDIVEIYRSG